MESVHSYVEQDIMDFERAAVNLQSVSSTLLRTIAPLQPFHQYGVKYIAAKFRSPRRSGVFRHAKYKDN